MGLYVIFGTLAAFGFVCFLGILLGIGFRSKAPLVVLCCRGKTPVLGLLCFLRELGILRGKLLLVGAEPPLRRPYIACCTEEELTQILAQEAK